MCTFRITASTHGAGPRTREPAMTDASTHELVGCEVTIKGLDGKPELNGRLGRVKQWLPDRGRLAVKLLDDDGVEDRREAPVAVKPDNVEKVDLAEKFSNMRVIDGVKYRRDPSNVGTGMHGEVFKPHPEWDHTNPMRRHPFYDKLVLSYCLRVEEEYKYSGELFGLYNWQAEGNPVPRKGSRDNEVHREFMRYIRRARRIGQLAASWFKDQHYEELATYAAHKGDLYFAWEKEDVENRMGSGSAAELRAFAASVVRSEFDFGSDWFSTEDYSDDEEYSSYDDEDDDDDDDGDDDDDDSSSSTYGDYCGENDDGSHDDD